MYKIETLKKYKDWEYIPPQAISSRSRITACAHCESFIRAKDASYRSNALTYQLRRFWTFMSRGEICISCAKTLGIEW